MNIELGRIDLIKLVRYLDQNEISLVESKKLVEDTWDVWKKLTTNHERIEGYAPNVEFVILLITCILYEPEVVKFMADRGNLHTQGLWWRQVALFNKSIAEVNQEDQQKTIDEAHERIEIQEKVIESSITCIGELAEALEQAEDERNGCTCYPAEPTEDEPLAPCSECGEFDHRSGDCPFKVKGGKDETNSVDTDSTDEEAS